METKDRFIEHYKNGYTPWVHSEPDFNLIQVVKNWPVAKGRVLEIGCGTGTDAIWLAKQGFRVTAIDAADTAIEMAIEQAAQKAVSVEFLVADFLNDDFPKNTYDFVFDRGYFHSYNSKKKRRQIAKKIASLLKDDGVWLSLVGSCDSPPRESGPPMRSAKNIVNSAEKYLEIASLTTSVFGSEQENPAKIWVCIFKKRN